MAVGTLSNFRGVDRREGLSWNYFTSTTARRLLHLQGEDYGADLSGVEIMSHEADVVAAGREFQLFAQLDAVAGKLLEGRRLGIAAHGMEKFCCLSCVASESDGADFQVHRAGIGWVDFDAAERDGH
jgi:hypothetical protein